MHREVEMFCQAEWKKIVFQNESYTALLDGIHQTIRLM